MGPDKVRKQPWPPWAGSLSLGTLETLALLGSSARAFYKGERNQIGNGAVEEPQRPSPPSWAALSTKAGAEKLPDG